VAPRRKKASALARTFVLGVGVIALAIYRPPAASARKEGSK